MFFLLFYTFVAFTVLPTKTLALFVNLTLKQNALFRAIFKLPHFFGCFSFHRKYFLFPNLTGTTDRFFCAAPAKMYLSPLIDSRLA